MEVGYVYKSIDDLVLIASMHLSSTKEKVPDGSKRYKDKAYIQMLFPEKGYIDLSEMRFNNKRQIRDQTVRELSRIFIDIVRKELIEEDINITEVYLQHRYDENCFSVYDLFISKDHLNNETTPTPNLKKMANTKSLWKIIKNYLMRHIKR